MQKLINKELSLRFYKSNEAALKKQKTINDLAFDWFSII